MEPGVCYNVADLVAHFDSEYNTSHGTIYNRLEELASEGQITRREHANNFVTYRLAADR